MRRFLLVFFGFCIAFCTIIIGLRFVWIVQTPYTLERNFLDENIHTIVLGASTTECLWDDAIISDSKNLSYSSNTNAACYSILKWAVEYNDIKIDTVILDASFVDMIYHTNDNLAAWQEESRGRLDFKGFFEHFKKSKEYWTMAVTTFPFSNLYSMRALKGRYLGLEGNKLDSKKVYDRINKRLEMVNWDRNGFTEEFIREKCTYQIDYLRKISDYCSKHDITLIYLFTPLYRIPNIASDKGYRSFVLSELGDNALVADYSQFELPDSTYYYDFEHLNKKGAAFFSNHIKNNGLLVNFAIDCCN